MNKLKKKIKKVLKEVEMDEFNFEDETQEIENVIKNKFPKLSPEKQQRMASDAMARELNKSDGDTPMTNEADNGSAVVQYDGERTDEEPFMMGGIKWQYVNGVYPNGKRDIAVYRYDHDMAYDYEWFRQTFIDRDNKSNVDEVSLKDIARATGGSLERKSNTEPSTDSAYDPRTGSRKVIPQQLSNTEPSTDSAYDPRTGKRKVIPQQLSNTEPSTDSAYDPRTGKRKVIPQKLSNTEISEMGDDYESDSREVEFGMDPNGELDYEALQKLADKMNQIGSEEDSVNRDHERDSREQQFGRDIYEYNEPDEGSNDQDYQARLQKKVNKKFDEPQRRPQRIAYPTSNKGLAEVSERVNPKMTKNDLLETITKLKKPRVIKTIKVKNIKNGK